MEDNTNLEKSNRHQVAEDEAYQFVYLEKKLGIGKEQILEAIEKVGNQPDDIEAYLRKNRSGKGLI